MVVQQQQQQLASHSIDFLHIFILIFRILSTEWRIYTLLWPADGTFFHQKPFAFDQKWDVIYFSWRMQEKTERKIIIILRVCAVQHIQFQWVI